MRFSRRSFAAVLCAACCAAARAGTTVFFNSSQIATPVASGVTSDTISSQGYLFTYTRDKLFTGGISTEPIGRQVRVPWPQGVEAQAVTAGPNPGGARLSIRRVDGKVFDLTSFTAKLLANTAGAGGSIEIMPLVNGEDAFNDPLYFNASGYYSQTFFYDTTPNYQGSTALLVGFEEYKIGLYVDFAFVGVTLECVTAPVDYDSDGDVDPADLAVFAACNSGPAIPPVFECYLMDLDYDDDVDQSDFAVFQRCYSGEGNPANVNCAN